MNCDKFWLNKILRQLIPIRTNLLTMHTWPYRLVGTSPPSSPNRITEKYVKMQPATITLLRRGLDILIILQNIKYSFNNTLEKCFIPILALLRYFQVTWHLTMNNLPPKVFEHTYYIKGWKYRTSDLLTSFLCYRIHHLKWDHLWLTFQRKTEYSLGSRLLPHLLSRYKKFIRRKNIPNSIPSTATTAIKANNPVAMDSSSVSRTVRSLGGPAPGKKNNN